MNSEALVRALVYKVGDSGCCEEINSEEGELALAIGWNFGADFKVLVKWSLEPLQ